MTGRETLGCACEMLTIVSTEESPPFLYTGFQENPSAVTGEKAGRSIVCHVGSNLCTVG
jgi:hypothetical protein